jgi:AcrR family transcriptional regulator
MSSERIVEGARRIVETGGVDALSMRKLAVELGVAPTAIYWHVGGREQVLGAVFDALLAGAAPLTVAGATPHARIANTAVAIRRHVREQPVLHQLGQHLGRSAEAAFAGHLALAREVTAAGLTGDDAADAVRSILFLIGGFVLLEGSFRRRPAGARTSQDFWHGVADSGIDPGLVAAMRRPADTDALFDYAIHGLLRSILP